MKPSFIRLPVEYHFDIAEYLDTPDITNLSQTCSVLRDIYTPLSWRKCVVIRYPQFNPKDDPEKVDMYIKRCDSNHKTYRYLREAVLRNPAKYSWFPKSAVHIVMIVEMNFKED